MNILFLKKIEPQAMNWVPIIFFKQFFKNRKIYGKISWDKFCKSENGVCLIYMMFNFIQLFLFANDN